MPEILHLDLDGFFVAVERQLDPALRGRPLIVGGQPDSHGRVIAASAEAGRAGVRPGLGLAVAAQRCPHAVFLDGSVDRYVEASAAVDELLRDPAITGGGVPIEWTAIDSVFLDVSGTRDRLGPGRRLAETIQTRLQSELGFDAAVGLAGTRIAAQIASRLSRPRGLLCILPGYDARILAPLDVGVLPDVTAAMRQRLMQLGVTTLDALARLDEVRAREILGGRAPVLQRWARAEDPRPVDGTAPPQSLSREVTFAAPEADQTRLAAVVVHVADVLGDRLRQMGWYTQTVTVRLRLAGAEDLPPERSPRPHVRDGVPSRWGSSELQVAQVASRTETLREATASAADLRAAAQALLKVLLRRRRVAGLGVTLSNLQRVGPQIPLFPRSVPAEGPSLRTRSGFRSLVEGRYLQRRPARRRAG